MSFVLCVGSAVDEHSRGRALDNRNRDSFGSLSMSMTAVLGDQ